MLRKKEKEAFHDFNWVEAFSSCTVVSMSKKKLKIKQVVYHEKVFTSDKKSFLKEKIQSIFFINILIPTERNLL